MDDTERIRIARAARADRTPGAAPSPGGTPAFLGRVTSASAPAGKYFLAIPVQVLGAEVAGGAGSVSDLTTQKTPVLLLGPRAANTGDLLVCRFVDHRWVAERGGGSGIIDPGHGTIPNCFCTDIPGTLTMTSADPNCNYRMFQSCTIQWQDTPAWAARLNLGPKIFLSTTSFADPVAGDAEFYYYLTCQYNQFSLTRLYPTSPFGSPYRDGILYTWLVGGYGNTCSPFHLDNGMAFPGSDASCNVVIDS